MAVCAMRLTGAPHALQGTHWPGLLKIYELRWLSMVSKKRLICECFNLLITVATVLAMLPCDISIDKERTTTDVTLGNKHNANQQTSTRMAKHILLYCRRIFHAYMYMAYFMCFSLGCCNMSSMGELSLYSIVVKVKYDCFQIFDFYY